MTAGYARSLDSCKTTVDCGRSSPVATIVRILVTGAIRSMTALIRSNTSSGVPLPSIVYEHARACDNSPTSGAVCR